MTKERKPKARFKITLRCDRACSYCINQCEEYRKRWKTISSPENVKWGNYRSVIISGGEPTLYFSVVSLVRKVRVIAGDQTLIYFQTNGVGLTKTMVKSFDDNIDGIGLSIHDLDEFRHMVTRWRDISKIKPIRLYVERSMYFENKEEIEGMIRGCDFHFRVWQDGESDPDEEIFLLKE